jgi:hypothetical protein
MSNKTIITKNSLLTMKLLEYLAGNPATVKGIPSGVSYVVFSEDDTKLNEYNAKLVTQLVVSGKNVVEAFETKNQKAPWKLHYISA